MADPFVRQARAVFDGTVGSTDLKAGDPVYFDGTDWEKADATDNTKFAEAIATNTFKSGDVGIFARSGVIVDTDAPYTQGDQYFLHTTAGEITATRPTGANNLVQVLGFGLSTSELYVDIPPVREQHVWLVASGTTGTVTAQLDSGNYGAVAIDADDEDIFFTLEVPQNCVGLEIAHIWTAPEALAGSPQMDIHVSGQINDEAHDATTPDTSFADTTVGGTADDIFKTDITSAFDAAGIFDAGNLLGIKVIGEGGATDIWLGLGINMVLKVV